MGRERGGSSMVLDSKDNKVIAKIFETVSVLERSFLKAYLFYNGGYTGGMYDSLLIDLPKISGDYYLPKPRIYKYRSPRDKLYTYVEIVSQLPLSSNVMRHPEYIVVMINISYSKKFRIQLLRERLHRVNRRIYKLSKLMGGKHYFIYFIYNRSVSGLEKEVKKIYAILRNRGSNTIIRSLTYNNADTIVNDLRRYIESRIIGFLDEKRYRKSKGYIFSYPKRFVEYLLILDALLMQNDIIAENISFILHNTSEYKVSKYKELLTKINNTKKENKNIRKIRTPSKPSIYI